MREPSIYAIADRLAPRLRAAFLRAIARIRSLVTLAALQRAIETGDPTAVIIATKIAQLPEALTPTTAVIDEIVADTADRAITELAVRAAFDLVNPRAAAAAQIQGARFVTGVTAETRHAIRTLVVRAVTDGIAPRELAALIKPLIGLTARQTQAVLNAREAWLEAGLSTDVVAKKAEAYAAKLLAQRAVAIARTETIAAAANGQLAAWRAAADAGLIDRSRTWRIWQAAIVSPRTCPRCRSLHDQVVAFDQVFVVPIDGETVWAPPLHPNCRCSVSLTFHADRSAA